MYNIPNEGQLWIPDEKYPETIYLKKGGQVYQLDIRGIAGGQKELYPGGPPPGYSGPTQEGVTTTLQRGYDILKNQYGIDIKSLPTYNYGDVRDAYIKMGAPENFTTTMDVNLFKSAVPTGSTTYTPGTITQPAQVGGVPIPSQVEAAAKFNAVYTPSGPNMAAAQALYPNLQNTVLNPVPLSGQGLTASKPYYRVQGTNEVYDSKTHAYMPEIKDWSQVEVVTQKPTGYYPTQTPQGTTITPENAQEEMRVSVPGAGFDNTSTSLVAGATQYSKELQKYIDMLATPESETDKQYNAIMSKYQDLLPELAKQGTDQLAAEQAQGIPALKQKLSEINAQILTKTAEYKALSADIEGKPITMASIIGAQAQIEKAKAAEIGLLQALALGLQGQITAAQDTANRAIDLKYSGIETSIKIYEAQLNALSGKLDKEQEKIANAQKLMLADRQAAIDEIKSAEKQATNYAIEMSSKYISAGILPTDSYETVNRKVMGSAEYQAEIAPAPSKSTGGGTSGGGTGTGEPEPITKFTDTQINKGAAAADIPIVDFVTLEPDTKNFFINNSGDIDKMKKMIDEAKANNEDPTAIEKEISESNAPDAVKDTLVRYLWSVFPRPTGEKQFRWWNPTTWF